MKPLCERCRLSAHEGSCKPDTYMPAEARQIYGTGEDAAQAPAAPEWVMVPREPTQAMVMAAALHGTMPQDGVFQQRCMDEFTAAYKRALAIAATAPAQAAHPEPVLVAAQAAHSAPVAKALEFAEYMAQRAEQYLLVLNHEQAAKQELDTNSDEDRDALLMDALDRAIESSNEHATGLRSSIYEFRKRAKRAAPDHPATQTPRPNEHELGADGGAQGKEER